MSQRASELNSRLSRYCLADEINEKVKHESELDFISHCPQGCSDIGIYGKLWSLDSIRGSQIATLFIESCRSIHFMRAWQVFNNMGSWADFCWIHLLEPYVQPVFFIKTFILLHAVKCSGAAFAGDIERDVDDHVLLSAHHAAAASFHQNIPRVHAVIRAGFFGVPQE